MNSAKLSAAEENTPVKHCGGLHEAEGRRPGDLISPGGAGWPRRRN